MHLSFLPEGPGGRPALILSRVTPSAARLFRDTVEPLMAGISRRMPFHEIAGLSNPAGLSFAGVPGATPGARQVSATAFDWEETLPGWLRVYDLLEPFATADAAATPLRAQLTSAGGISVVVTTGAEG